MNKKILLSTLLATSIIGGAGNAFAVITIGYQNGPNPQFTINNTPINLTQVNQNSFAQFKGRLDRGEKIAFAPGTVANLKNDLQNASREDKEAIKDMIKMSKPYLSKEAKEELAQFGRKKKPTPNPNDAPVLQNEQVVQNLNNITTLTKSTKARFIQKMRETLSDDNKAKMKDLQNRGETLSKELENDPNNPVLINQMTVLIDESTAFEEEVKMQARKRPEVIAMRNSPETQEELKQGLKAIEVLKNAAKTDLEKQAVEAKLKKIQEDYLEMYLADEKKTEHKDLAPVQKSDTHTVSGIAATSAVHSNVLTNRMSSFAGAGVASGDADSVQTYGAWVKGHFGTGAQKAFKAEPGYKFTQKGVTIGADTGDDEYVIGLAVSYFKNDVTNKSGLSAKDKIDSGMLSAYGMFAVTPEVFVSGQFTYGMSAIKKSRNTGDLANNKATAKTKGNNYGGRAEVGYVYALGGNTELVPTVGVSHNQVEVKGYTEKGNGLNRKVGKMTNNRTSGLAGITLKHMADTGSVKIVPELHANVDYAFSGKNSATKYILANLIDRTTPSEKASKLYLNLGTSVKFIASDMFDVTAGYDMGASKKFMSHTGSVKLRVNF